MNSLRPLLFDQIEKYFSALVREIDLQTGRFLSLCIEINEEPFVKSIAEKEPFYHWVHPNKKITVMGYGHAFSYHAAGTARLKKLSSFHSDIKKKWKHIDPDKTGHDPVFFTYFSFFIDSKKAGESTAVLHLPILTFQKYDDKKSLIFSWNLEQGRDFDTIFTCWREAAELYLTSRFSSQRQELASNRLVRCKTYPSDECWLKRTEQAIADIQDGVIQKIVLSRHLKLKADRAFDIPAVIERLSRRYPNCSIIAWNCDDGMMVGATPEKLLELKNGLVRCDALAGTRALNDPAINSENSAVLFKADAKIRDEHELVVRAIVEKLELVCNSVPEVSKPEILKLQVIEHLLTVIQGQVKKDMNLLDLANLLHPTPAVGGYPLQSASDWMEANQEKRPHGYSGAFGWMTLAGDGELSVALRCAFLQGRYAELSAGAGVVAQSDPLSELEEIEFKFQAMLNVLAGM